jgi:hypothetical protein
MTPRQRRRVAPRVIDLNGRVFKAGLKLAAVRPICPQSVAQEPSSRALDLDSVTQRPESVVQRNQERQRLSNRITWTLRLLIARARVNGRRPKVADRLTWASGVGASVVACRKQMKRG